MIIKMKFRNDINGIRAYAVASVVLFHFGVFGFTGGFIGVDVFFVISGFLMTKIIMDGLKKDQFSIIQFYTNRAIRIIPALAFLCFILLIIGWFQLIPTDFKALSKHIIASLFFVSNIIYWRESGYFDAESHEKILLHTWSLSVEWQFYLLLPIYLVLAYRLLKQKTIYSLTVLFIASLILASFASTYRPSASFYLLPTRAWEMILGGFLYFIPKPNLNRALVYTLEIIGFFLVISSLYLFTSKTLWPSLYTLIPTLGTALILYVKNQDSIFTNNKIAQFLGNSSYSIYLWHWPIVFWMYNKDFQGNIYFIIFGLFLSVLLGFLSAKYIEKLAGNKLKDQSTLKPNLIIVGTCTIVVSLSIFVFITQGANIKIRDAANTPQALLVESSFTEHKNIHAAYMLQCDVYSNLIERNFNGISNSCINKKIQINQFSYGATHTLKRYR